ncbi:MAG TPA: type II secretion system protein [Planctomycetota bacterium]
MGSRRRGFTLIEMLVVVGIILLLLALLIAVINSVMQQKRITQTTTLISDVHAAVIAYYAEFHCYPPDTDVYATGTTPETMAAVPESIFKCLGVPWVDKQGATHGPFLYCPPALLRGPNRRTLVDAWGNPIHLDAMHSEINTESGSVTVRGEPYPPGTPLSQRTEDFKIWSNGSDGREREGSNCVSGKNDQAYPENKDNIISW